MVEIKKFEELERDEIYQIAQLRNDIFIHEQAMDMRNLDAMDYIADHAFIKEGYSVVCYMSCLLYTSPSPRDGLLSRMPSSA